MIALLIAVWYFTLGPGHVTVNVNNNGGTTQPVPSVQAPAGGGQASQAPAASPAAS